MLRTLGEAARLAAAVGEAVGKVASTHGLDAAKWAWKKIPDLAAATAIVEQFNLNRTPVPVKVTCNQTGEGADDYNLLIDIDEIAAALNQGRVVVPQITIYAKYPEMLNRDLLAERLEDALKPLLEEYKAQVERRKAQVVKKRRKEESDAFWTDIGLSFDLSIIAYIFPSAVLLLAAIHFAGFVKQLPSLILARFKGDELDQLDAELTIARATIKEVVRKMKIEQLP